VLRLPLCAVIAALAAGPLGAVEREIGRLANGARVAAVQGANGKWILAITGAEPALTMPEPVSIELFSEARSARYVSAGYDAVRQEGAAWVARGSVAQGGATVGFEDRWSIAGAALRLHRTVRVRGNAAEGFASAARFFTAELLPRDRMRLFAPGMMYGGTDHLTRSAIGGADFFTGGKWPALRIREDRLPAPLFGFVFPGGGYAAVLDAAPNGGSTVEDTRDAKIQTVVDRRLRFASLGAEPAGNALALGVWYPGVEGEVTYTGDTYPGGQHRQWRRRYHPLLDGLSQEYRVDFIFGRTATFREAYREMWRAAWKTLAPRVNPQDIEAARRALLDHLAARAVSAPGGRTGIDNFIDLFGGSRTHGAAILGFTGKNIEAANYLLEDTGPNAAEHHRIGAAIMDSFVRLKVDPPEGEGFSLATGMPALAIPRDSVVYLRSFGDDMKAALRAVAFEREHGREHPEWLAWARRFGDWLLTQQAPAGGIPRSWRPVTGVVADPSPQSTYNAVPLLVLLTQLTGGPKYARAALRAGEFAWGSGQESGVFVGGTIDNPDVIDKEAGTLSLEAFLALYDSTHDRKWIDRARVAADYAETWMYIWDVPMAEGEDAAKLHWKPGVRTTGLQLISSGHSLVDAYMGFDVDEYARLYRLTGDANYLDVARILLHNTLAMTAVPGRLYDWPAPGWQQEHWSLAPRRGYGLHRGWLPWVSTSHLNGIFELEHADPKLFEELKMAR
jgi:hypothetical protein